MIRSGTPLVSLIPASRHLLLVRYKSTPLRSPDSEFESDEVVSPNNPWLPTLYTDPVRVYSRASWPLSRTLPSHMRLSYTPLYDSPGGKYAGMLRKTTFGFALCGAYAAKLIADLAQFDDVYAITALTACIIPWIVVQVKTRHYVVRLWRLYDNRDTPQTLELLTTNETLVAEKLTIGGGRTYNELINVDSLLRLASPPNAVSRVLGPYTAWTQNKTHHYIADNVGGLKMDRIWGIVEKNSGVNNGRFFE